MDRKASPFTLGPEHPSYSSSTVIFHTEPYYTVVDILSYYPGVKARKISTSEWVTVNTYHRQFVKGLCCPLYVRLTVLKPDPGVCGSGHSKRHTGVCNFYYLPGYGRQPDAPRGGCLYHCCRSTQISKREKE